MRKFFATLAVCLCVMSVSAFENQNTSSELKSTNVSQMTVGADQGQATEYVFATAEGTAFTGDVFVRPLPNNIGNELCFKATSGEYFMVSLFNAQDFTNVSCTRQAPSGKLKKVKKSKVYFTDANQSVLIVSPNDAGQNRIVKVRLN